jgi:bacterioferritin
MAHFAKDLEDLRHRAEEKMEEGAVTQSYKGDVKKAIEILNEALATEIVCVLRYMHHYFMATGVHGKGVSDEFKEHADAEREHADMLAERIQQLGGKPDFNPKNLVERSVTQYVEGETLADMIREDLIAERIVIEVYQGMIRYFANDDPTTRVILEKLLHDEEEHADDLADLLYIVNPETAQTEGQDPGTEPLRMHRDRQDQTDGAAGGQSRQRSMQEIAQSRDQAVERSNARLSSQGGGDERELKEAQGRTTPPQPSGEEVFESHKRDRDRILNELRWMGKGKKKKKPAA